MKKVICFILAIISFQTMVAQAWSCTTLSGGCYRTGPVGLGAPATSYMLDVKSTMFDNGISYYYTGSQANCNSFFQLGNVVNSKYWRIQLDGTSDGNLFFNDGSSNPPFFIHGTSKNVGLGTSTPSGKFEVRDANNAEMIAYSTSNVSASAWVMNSLTNYALFIDANGTGHISQNRSSPLHLMNFYWNLNVGGGKPQVWIGPRKQISPGHTDFRFSVDGKILSTEVIVTQQNWADFVFEKNYKLMPLEELEKYYSQFKRLPDVPSEKEVIDNGLDIGDSQKILLQKIEELTLYLVEEHKIIKDQQEKINRLQSELDRLSRK
jgi:hypothetical protein